MSRIEWVESRAGWIAAALVAIATARIVATYTVFNHTIDEPAHLACGMEWIEKGLYRYEVQHPPLTRVAAALVPYLAGVRGHSRPAMYNEGAAILYTGGQYDRNLALARSGILVFFWLASVVVFVWADRAAGKLAAVCSVLLFTFLPPVLAHAGLATTDMGLAACLSAAFLMLLVWAERPSRIHTALLGLAGGAAVLSKFSAIPFFASAVLLAAAVYLRSRSGGAIRSRVLPILAAAGLAGLVIWAGYRFSTGEFFAGIQSVIQHNRDGHPAYLLGELSRTGWWYYYLVVLAVKTPIPLMALVGVGIAVGRKKGWLGYAVAFAGGILLFASFFSRINIGVRHILPVYVAGTVIAGAGLAYLLRQSGWLRTAVPLLLAWYCGDSLLSHPDYIPYFNAFAGDQPEKILVDSDLDWGQDVKRLGRRLRELGATNVAFDPFIVAHYQPVHGFPPIQPLDPIQPLPGWNAVGLTMLKIDRMGLKEEHKEIQPWPERTRPAERIGKTTWLYYATPVPSR